ncbi:MAG: hypothetical protein O7E52_05165 [Candidatus Poribacteria bacterium]|nr:hypothetical protein [Candidatus Poribacteria bacterium]
MSDATSLPESSRTQAQTPQHGGGPPEVPDVQRITQQYLKALSKIKEVELACYRLRQQCIEFVVVVSGRVHRKLSQQLARIEGQLFDDYPDWSFDFEHISFAAYTQQGRAGYLCLFNRE